jgi:hypothetical protein
LIGIRNFDSYLNNAFTVRSTILNEEQFIYNLSEIIYGFHLIKLPGIGRQSTILYKIDQSLVPASEIKGLTEQFVYVHCFIIYF